MATDTDLRKIVGDIKQSKKYAHLSFETVYRIVKWAALRYARNKDIDGNSRKKLHQIYGAYLSHFDESILHKLNNPDNIDTNDLKGTFEIILSQHNSTQERLPFLGSFYAQLYTGMGKQERIVDIGCGFNPFTYPWIAEHFGDIKYVGYDIDVEATGVMSDIFKNLNLPVQVGYNDIFSSLPDHTEDDVVFLLKLLPCLEQQEKGISHKILDSIKSNTLVISFPSKSLGGKNKGMVEHYRQFLDLLISNIGYDCRPIFFPTETAYILTKKHA